MRARSFLQLTLGHGCAGGLSSAPPPVPVQAFNDRQPLDQTPSLEPGLSAVGGG
jgi:hypothetical protein